MGGKTRRREMAQVEDVDIDAVQYKAWPAPSFPPRLTGMALRAAVWLMESPLFGPIINSVIKRQNNYTQMLEHTVIPEPPMYFPEFPRQEEEPGVLVLDEDKDPIDRVATTLECLLSYEPSTRWSEDAPPFIYWKIRDFAHAYRSAITTPSIVVEHIISAIEKWNNREPAMPLLLYFNADDLRKQADASTKRFEEGNPLSILDGIFVAIKDDIDCLPYPTGGGTTWLYKTYVPEQDALLVDRLRHCGVITVGKANMHELGLGTTGSNPNFGTVRNPHSIGHYTGGSSSGPAAIVSLGLCSAAIGTDGGGSVRIPASLCGVVGLKTTFGRIDMKGTLCESGTVEVASPLAATVEDAMLVYAAMAGSPLSYKISLQTPPVCVPNLSSSDNFKILQSLKFGIYREWFHDVENNEVSSKCEGALNLLVDSFGSHIVEIKLPELEEMCAAHLVSIGSESLADLNPDYKNGIRSLLTPEVRIILAHFGSFSSTDYVAAQRLRRRIMYYHMEAFEKADIIVTPTAGITAPKITPGSLKVGESDYALSAYLMRYVIAGNLLGLPAISVPIGHDKNGLPIGLQLIGRPWGEATILRAASALEELCLKYRNRPPTFCDVLSSK